ncbi:polysaccharide biosynthesis tyrosine autokinase [Pantoea phytobeneficialis]|uniref:Polysaccharide biosynthesis tyrosine autokinase n=1 Tax=Pantoea phytobeneficialis TaxID=2052056 RepID=A0AAP9KMX1_9GAMM|nr:polysaccharide biosynthesis tyrosine autokinase [Pantoea phytobeneficialis]MDO6405907.1 polysaccharide biosynthesis tyrosine autokinase [Pantoea phytobeneficialis]QGR05202.1 tyrosine-protein kinase [Pantoea phytobeneficialis]
MPMKPVVNMLMDDEEGVDTSRLFAELLESRYLILVITVSFMLMAWVYTLLTPVVYQANALIQLEPQRANAILANQNSTPLPDGKPVSAIDVKLLQSRHILGATVDDLNLQVVVEPKHMPIIGSALATLTGKSSGEIDVSQLFLPGTTDDNSEQVTLTVLDSRHYQINWGNASFVAETGKVFAHAGMQILVASINALPGTQFTATYLSRLNAINRLQHQLSAQDPDINSSMIRLTLTGEDQHETMRVLDNIASHYLHQNISEQVAQDSRSLVYLNQQLPEVRSELDRNEDKLNAAREKNGTVDLPLEAQSVLDQSVDIDNQLNELTINEADISQLYTKDHPMYKTLLDKRQTLLAARDGLKEKIAAMPAVQQEILRLTRDVDSGQTLYMHLLSRQQELNIAVSSAIGNARVLDHPLDDPEPVSPNKYLIIIQGLLLGLLVSINVIFIRFVLDKAVETSEELEEQGMTVYSSIPFSPWLEKSNKKNIYKMAKAFLLRENPTDLAIEALRSLRTNIHFSMLEARNNILMISGASASVGKTFISTNFSAVMAQTGKKVLLIDADLRRGTAHHIFNVKEKAGLSNILAAKYPIESIQPITISDDLHFIGRGTLDQGFTELLMSRRFGDLMRWAEKNYDLVVVDTPPVLAVTDAEIIGAYAGTTMLVVRCEKNTLKEVEISQRRFERNGIHINGCILNGTKLRSYGYYRYSNIQYTYESARQG